MGRTTPKSAVPGLRGLLGPALLVVPQARWGEKWMADADAEAFGSHRGLPFWLLLEMPRRHGMTDVVPPPVLTG